MDLDFLPYILILISSLLISSLCLFIPTYGRIISYIVTIIGQLLFIGTLHGVQQGHLTEMFFISSEKIQLVKLLSILNIVAIFLNGHSNMKKICNSLCIGLGHLGSIFLIGATEFIVFYIAMEILNLIFCSLVAFSNTGPSKESAVTFYIQNLIITGLFLLGISFFYGSTGGFTFVDFNIQNQQFYILSIVFLLAVAFFKIGLFPFHYWKRDVYSNISDGNTIMALTINKIILSYIFIILLQKLIFECSPDYQELFILIITTIAIFNAFYGNVMALVQKEVKKIIAYSSLAASGHIIMALCMEPNENFNRQLLFYLVFYCFFIIGVILALNILLQNKNDHYHILKGAFYKNKFAAICLLIFILALAGVPLTAGFYTKYLLFSNYFRYGFMKETMIFLVSSIICFFYYGKIVLILFMGEQKQKIIPSKNLQINIIQLALLIIVVIGGIWPTVFLK